MLRRIRSDNGTNLVGAQRELKEALLIWNQIKILNALLQEGVKWSLNMPAASHHSGVWERLIRMVRQVLSSVLNQRVPHDEGLHSILCEVEAILNNHPTTASEDPHDLEPLTPNHIPSSRTVPEIRS